MKKYIVKQTIAHNGKPEKTATFTVQADTEAQAAGHSDLSSAERRTVPRDHLPG